MQPGSARSSQEQTGATKCNQEQPIPRLGLATSIHELQPVLCNLSYAICVRYPNMVPKLRYLGWDMLTRHLQVQSRLYNVS